MWVYVYRNSSITKSTTFLDVEPETDNLVEEVYVAEDSWHQTGGKGSFTLNATCI